MRTIEITDTEMSTRLARYSELAPLEAEKK